MRKLWFVKHPITQYNEDVKALAKDKNLRIVDDKFKADADPDAIEQNPPELTKQGEEAPKAKAKPKAKRKKKAAKE